MENTENQLLWRSCSYLKLHDSSPGDKDHVDPPLHMFNTRGFMNLPHLIPSPFCHPVQFETQKTQPTRLEKRGICSAVIPSYVDHLWSLFYTPAFSHIPTWHHQTARYITCTLTYSLAKLHVFSIPKWLLSFSIGLLQQSVFLEKTKQNIGPAQVVQE